MAASSKTGRSRVGRPKGSNREATLANILLAARKLFAEKGYTQTTFKDVGKAVGVTHAAIYSYFSSKVELYVATAEHTQALLLPDYIEAMQQGGSLREQFTGILMASAEAHDRDSTITGFLASIPIDIRRHSELAAAMTQVRNATKDALEQMFEEAKRSGELTTNASAEDLMVALMGGGVGVALMQYGLQRDSLSEVMSVYVDLIESRLFKPKD